MNDFWHEKWSKKEIGFHQSDFHSLLKEYSHLFFDDYAQKKILVPLCGKSLDMLYLLKKGASVFGVELSEIACREFFEENQIAYEVKRVGQHQLFLAQDIQILCGDILTFDFEGYSFDGVYDRAALIALEPTLRQKYLKLMIDLDISKYFLITLEFDNSIIGPPFSISKKMVESYFDRVYKVVEALEFDRDVDIHKDKITKLKENLIILEK